METVTLKALLTGIGTSVNEAQNAIRKSEIEDFFSYFEAESEEGDNCIPRIKNIIIPAENSRLHKNTQIAVPLASMVHHKNMLMDELIITLHGKIKESEGEPAIELGRCDDQSNVQDELKLVYRCQEATEEQEQIVSAIMQNII